MTTLSLSANFIFILIYDLLTLRTLCCKPCLSLETRIWSDKGCLDRLLPSTSASVPPTLYLAASKYSNMERICDKIQQLIRASV